MANVYTVKHVVDCPEVASFPINQIQNPWNDHKVVEAAMFFCIQWKRCRRILAYCRKGANRSAAFCALIIAAATGEDVEEAATSANICFGRLCSQTRHFRVTMRIQVQRQALA